MRDTSCWMALKYVFTGRKHVIDDKNKELLMKY